MTAVRLLVIDDSATVRAMVEQVVAQEPGFEVAAVAASVEAARAMLDTARPDLVTLDLNMPGAHGLEFLDGLTARWRAPVVVLSSATSAEADETREALTRGAAACFDKSRILADAPAFRRLLRRLIDRDRRRLAVA